MGAAGAEYRSTPGLSDELRVHYARVPRAGDKRVSTRDQYFQRHVGSMNSFNLWRAVNPPGAEIEAERSIRWIGRRRDRALIGRGPQRSRSVPLCERPAQAGNFHLADSLYATLGLPTAETSGRYQRHNQGIPCQGADGWDAHAQMRHRWANFRPLWNHEPCDCSSRLSRLRLVTQHVQVFGRAQRFTSVHSLAARHRLALPPGDGGCDAIYWRAPDGNVMLGITRRKGPPAPRRLVLTSSANRPGRTFCFG